MNLLAWLIAPRYMIVRALLRAERQPPKKNQPTKAEIKTGWTFILTVAVVLIVIAVVTGA